MTNLLSEDAVIMRLLKGPLSQREVKSPSTTRWLVRLQRRGLVENLYIAKGSDVQMYFRLKASVVR